MSLSAISGDAYDHTTNAGNQGDVPKHVLVANLVSALAMPRQPFVYAESHAGRSVYKLPHSGEWTRGVGKLFAVPEVRQYISSPDTAHVPVSEVIPFIDLYAAAPPAAGGAYFGSSRIARDLLASKHVDYQMQLWDSDPAVVQELTAAYAQDDPHVVVHVGDGYRGVMALKKSSLVLIDPPGIDASALELAAVLTKQRRAFVCWTPLRSRSGPKGGSASEAQTSQRFWKQTTDAGYTALRVRWSNWGDRTPGCQITVSADISERARRCIEQTSGLMGWHYADDV
jgi:23S rRNA A2030 N6-methylase RlmJ